MAKLKPLLLASRSYAYLQREMQALGFGNLGQVEINDFPDGERYQRIVTPVYSRDVVLIGGTISDGDTLELYDLACAIVKYGAQSLTLVIPYFSYSTMERAVKAGEVVTAKTRARLFSAIPTASYGNRIVLLDLHSEGIPHYFEGSLRPVHLYAKNIVLKAARKLGGKRFVLASTDAGRAKWVQSLANDLGVDAAFVFKKRLSGSRTKLTAMSASVQGQPVVIYDDMIRTGGSLLEAARAYREAGATRLSVVTTHGLFPGEALKKLETSGLLDRIICTNSHPRTLALRSKFLQVESVASLFIDYLRGDQ
jgi:ribose-phosphate pyrophosphokinase